MRRIKNVSNKIIILVILSGFFNLLSYCFDQLVIQAELKNRDLERRLVSNRISLETLSYEISTLNDLRFEIVKSTDYFHKHLPTNLYGAISFLGKDKNSEFSWQKIYDEKTAKKIGDNFLNNLNQLILDYNKKTDDIDKVFKSIFPEPVFYNRLLGKYYPIKELKINEKILNTFNTNVSEDEDEQYKRDSENYKIYTKIYESIREFKTLEYQFDYYLKRSERKYVIQFSDFFNFVDEYAKEQNKINYFILLSIIAQIMGILFILLLFKSIMINKNN